MVLTVCVLLISTHRVLLAGGFEYPAVPCPLTEVYILRLIGWNHKRAGAKETHRWKAG